MMESIIKQIEKNVHVFVICSQHNYEKEHCAESKIQCWVRIICIAEDLAAGFRELVYHKTLQIPLCIQGMELVPL